MTARGRLVGVQRVLTGALALRALLIGVAVAALGWAVANAVALPRAVLFMVLLAAFGVTVVQGRRVLPARSLERVALWVEERNPTLRYALVTAAGADGGPEVERHALQTPWWRESKRRAARAVLAPAAWATAALALAIWHPAFDDARPGGSGRMLGPGRAAAFDPLASLRVRVIAPRYSGRAPASFDDPTSVEALVGSVVTVDGAAPGPLPSAVIDSTARPVSREDGRWELTLRMPPRPALLRLTSGAGRERLLVLAPVADAPPAVTLQLPTRDTVVRAASGQVVLRAGLRDDLGLRDAAFEIIVSSGQEENFTFRTATVARAAMGGRTDGSITARLSLDSLALKPGDVLQMRAVARDANDVTGPGFGSSETRALRVARAGEYDSVAVEGAPPTEPEGQVLSQRMLIMLTEALDRRRPRLARASLLAESARIAEDQRRLRKRVGDVVFQRTGSEPLAEEDETEERTGKLTPEELLARARDAGARSPGAVMDVEGDETPILAVNKPLLEAFNAMWDAGRALEQGDTRAALPPMRRALAAIERARQAERIYLRGRPAAVVVDVGRARLAGKERGLSSTREPRLPADPAARRRAARFARASALLAREPAAAADTLLVMRVEALGESPQLAAALDDAARAARRADRGAIPLAWARVRRALHGAPLRRDSLPAWDGAP